MATNICSTNSRCDDGYSGARKILVSDRSIIADWVAVDRPHTLLGVCPNSRLVTVAAIRAGAALAAPILFAATLNQVDDEGGYTPWNPHDLVAFVNEQCAHANVTSYPVCLDHGGPHQKDAHSYLSFDDSLAAVRSSLASCIDAGYSMLHIDCTVPKTVGESIDASIERTVELVAFCEETRRKRSSQQLEYELGSDEVKGGLTDIAQFEYFLNQITQSLQRNNLPLPLFVVAQLGTSVASTTLDESRTQELAQVAAKFNTGLKCHFADYTDDPSILITLRVRGANVGPEFSAAQYRAIKELNNQESSTVIAAVNRAVIESGRWRKWTSYSEPEEFGELTEGRKEFLLETCSRYVWEEDRVSAAISELFELSGNAREVVISAIQSRIERYIRGFGLVGMDG